MELMETNSKNWLEEEFKKKRGRNPRYSLRAFARHLEISPARLSQYLSGKRQLTLKAGKIIARNLEYDPEIEKLFLKLISTEKIKKNIKADSIDEGHFQLSVDSFHLIADWYYYAILNLTKIKKFKFDTKWIAKKLGLSTIEVSNAIERLFRLKLIKKTDNTIERTYQKLKTQTDIASRALKISHKQSLEQAIEKIDETPLDMRDVTSMTMAIDTKNIPEAKKIITKFRRELTNLLEAGEADDVYNLNIQLVPVTKREIVK